MLDPQLLDLGVAELEDHVAGRHHWSDDIDHNYALVRWLYLRGQVAELRELLTHAATRDGGHHPTIAALGMLRLAIRTESENVLARDQALEMLNQCDGTLAAEARLVLAMYCETFGDNRTAESYYRDSYGGFVKAGCPKKAATAYMNMIAARSRIEPDRRLIVEYRRALALASRADETRVQGTVLKNLSREYQLMGALELAEHYADSAVNLTASSAYGTYDYYQTIAHRLHVAAQMGNLRRARLDYEELKTALLPDIESILSCVDQVLHQLGIDFQRTPLPPATTTSTCSTWHDRMQLTANIEPLTPLENKLLSLLESGPLEKSELLEGLYGATAHNDFFTYDNRLKQLLHRLRKKRQDVIGLTSGKYFLIDRRQLFGLG